MTHLAAVDVALVSVAVAYVVVGYRSGLLMSLFSLAGVVAGTVGAVIALPWVVERTGTQPQARLLVAAAVLVVLVGLGQGLGAYVGRKARKITDFRFIRTLDRLLGGAVNLAVWGVLVIMGTSMLAPLGVAEVNRAISGSQVVGLLNRHVPERAREAVGSLRAFTLAEGLPRIAQALHPQVDLSPPTTPSQSPEVEGASQAVVRITGTAHQCSQLKSGTGFVVAPDRVMTNAHVVAGVANPVVETRSGQNLAGTVVEFNAAKDIAVVAVSGMEAGPLPFGADLGTGEAAVVLGYPGGGPFQAKPARVESLQPTLVKDIYQKDASLSSLYTLAADVQKGNSGGPLLNLRGEVVGLVFAKTVEREGGGYALSVEEIAPAAHASALDDEPADTGACLVN